MKPLHKIHPNYTPEQLASIWWIEHQNFKGLRYFFGDNGVLVQISPNGQQNPWTQADIDIVMVEWMHAGKPRLQPIQMVPK